MNLDPREAVNDLEGIEYALLGLVLVTGLIHLYVGATSDFMLLTLAGLGFFGGAVLFLLECRRDFLAAAVIPYTLLQFWEYYQFYGFTGGTLAVLDKAVQTALVLLAVYYVADSRNLF